MISRKTTRRLEAIEARLAPAAEPVIAQMVYITPPAAAFSATFGGLRLPSATVPF